VRFRNVALMRNATAGQLKHFRYPFSSDLRVLTPGRGGLDNLASSAQICHHGYLFVDAVALAKIDNPRTALIDFWASDRRHPRFWKQFRLSDAPDAAIASPAFGGMFISFRGLAPILPAAARQVSQS